MKNEINVPTDQFAFSSKERGKDREGVDVKGATGDRIRHDQML